MRIDPYQTQILNIFFILSSVITSAGAPPGVVSIASIIDTKEKKAVCKEALEITNKKQEVIRFYDEVAENVADVSEEQLIKIYCSCIRKRIFAMIGSLSSPVHNMFIPALNTKFEVPFITTYPPTQRASPEFYNINRTEPTIINSEIAKIYNTPRLLLSRDEEDKMIFEANMRYKATLANQHEARRKYKILPNPNYNQKHNRNKYRNNYSSQNYSDHDPSRDYYGVVDLGRYARESYKNSLEGFYPHLPFIYAAGTNQSVEKKEERSLRLERSPIEIVERESLEEVEYDKKRTQNSNDETNSYIENQIENLDDHNDEELYRMKRSYRRVDNRATFTFYMRPLIHKAILDLVIAFKWKHIYYMYDHPDALSRIQYLHFRLNRQRMTVDITPSRVDDVNYSNELIRRLDAKVLNGSKYFILDMNSTERTINMMRMLQNVGLNRPNYHYLFHTMVFNEMDLEDFKHGGANITGFSLCEHTSLPIHSSSYYRYRKNKKQSGNTINLEKALVLDSVTAMTHGLSMAFKLNRDLLEQSHFKNKPYLNKCKVNDSWTLSYGKEISSSLNKVNFKGLTGYVSFDERGFRKNYSLTILEQRLDGVPTKIGVWNSGSGIDFNLHSGYSYTPGTINNNRTLVVTSIVSEPYLFKRKVDYEGYCVDLTQEIAKKLGFNYDIKLVEDNRYGEKLDNGTWNGMIGELTKKKADMAVAPLTITSIRERVIDFSKPFMNLGISIMIKKPDKQKPGVFSFMDPLSVNIWLCIIISYLGVSSVLFFVSRFSPNEWQIEDSVHGPTYVNDFTILNSLWFALGAFMRRGCEVCPRSLSGRIVGSAWWFFTLIIISSYTANLAAFLTIERMLTPIQNADDLSKQTDIQYGTLRAGSTADFFKASKIPVYKRMWSFMSTHEGVFVDKTEQGIQKVRNSKGKYAFLVESTMNDYANQRLPCNTMKIGDNLDSKGYGVATYLGSALRGKINVAVLNLLESEYLQKLQKKWWYDKGECVIESENKGSGSSQSSLSLSNVAGIFYILIGGLGLSMVIASLEFFYKSRVELKRQKKRYLEKCRYYSSEFYNDNENGGFYKDQDQVVDDEESLTKEASNTEKLLDTDNQTQV